MTETSVDKANVLIVDDRDENLFATQAILRDLGVHTLTAKSGEEALQMVLRHEISLILLDVQMPGMDGFEVASLLRQHENTRRIPIIFMTALDQRREWARKAISLGAVDYLCKPVDPDELRRKVKMYAHFWRARSLAFGSSRTGTGSEP